MCGGADYRSKTNDSVETLACWNDRHRRVVSGRFTVCLNMESADRLSYRCKESFHSGRTKLNIYEDVHVLRHIEECQTYQYTYMTGSHRDSGQRRRCRIKMLLNVSSVVRFALRQFVGTNTCTHKHDKLQSLSVSSLLRNVSWVTEVMTRASH